MWDQVLAETGHCLIARPGEKFLYSNLGIGILQLVIEYLTRPTGYATQQSFGGPGDSPLSQFDPSPLALFVRQYLRQPGDASAYGATRSQYGMYTGRSLNPYDPLGGQLDPEETSGRGYLSGVWNPPEPDDSGILCDQVGAGCVWIAGDMNRWQRWEPLPFPFGGRSFNSAVGGIITEAELYLRFMEQFYVSPPYGRMRRSWSTSASHTGQVTSARAVVRQVGRKVHDQRCTHTNADCNPNTAGHTCCPNGYECVNQNVGHAECTGSHAEACNICVKLMSYSYPNIADSTGDFVENVAIRKRSCLLPNGLDYFVAANQTTDANDADGGDYDYLEAFVLDALCKVDFPANPLTFWQESNLAGALPPTHGP